MKILSNNYTQHAAASSQTQKSEKDEFDIYGEYLAMKLRGLDKISCIYVQKSFNDIIFDAELGKYNPPNVVEVNYETSATGSQTQTTSTATASEIHIVETTGATTVTNEHSY